MPWAKVAWFRVPLWARAFRKISTRNESINQGLTDSKNRRIWPISSKLATSSSESDGSLGRYERRLLG